MVDQKRGPLLEKARAFFRFAGLHAGRHRAGGKDFVQISPRAIIRETEQVERVEQGSHRRMVSAGGYSAHQWAFLTGAVQ